jgi:hypothetical protein
MHSQAHALLSCLTVCVYVLKLEGIFIEAFLLIALSVSVAAIDVAVVTKMRLSNICT